MPLINLEAGKVSRVLKSHQKYEKLVIIQGN